MITTTETIPGYKIVRTIGLVTAVSEYKMSRPRKALYDALNNLIEQAKARGANAIIALRINATTGSEVMAIVVYGTAVRAEKEKSADSVK